MKPFLHLVLGAKGRKVTAPPQPTRPHPVRAATFHGETLVQCEHCRRWGKETWPHACDGVQWFVSPDALRVAENARLGAMKRPFLSDRKPQGSETSRTSR